MSDPAACGPEAGDPATRPGAVRFLPVDGGLRGSLTVPGDKSVSHRAALLGAVNDGPVSVTGFLRSADTLASLAAVQALGVPVEWRGDELTIRGNGWDGLREPEDVIDVANAGTLIRLLPGILASRPFLTVLTGDGSIRRRPMARILGPLAAMGADVAGRCGDTLPPIAIRGGGLRGGRLRGMEHELPVASAQVKSCLLLAGLQADGPTVVIEPGASRDHTERMVAYGGGTVERESLAGGCTRVTVQPTAGLHMDRVTVPGDFSSAAFFVVAGLLVPGSDIAIDGVGLNPTRAGLLAVLRRMGADLHAEETDMLGPEPVGRLTVSSSQLVATDVGADEVPNLIDELPLFLLAAARARGVSRLTGAAELRAKESDRLQVMAAFLRSLGVEVREYPDGMEVQGSEQGWTGGAMTAQGDHRMAMVAAVAGAASLTGVTVDDTDCIAVSFPSFMERLQTLGGSWTAAGQP